MSGHAQAGSAAATPCASLRSTRYGMRAAKRCRPDASQVHLVARRTLGVRAFPLTYLEAGRAQVYPEDRF